MIGEIGNIKLVIKIQNPKKIYPIKIFSKKSILFLLVNKISIKNFPNV
jgi:hypothetical protein